MSNKLGLEFFFFPGVKENSLCGHQHIKMFLTNSAVVFSEHEKHFPICLNKHSIHIKTQM